MSSHENPYASPVEALCAFWAYFWIDRSEQVALKQWKTYGQESSEQASLLLEHLKALAACRRELFDRRLRRIVHLAHEQKIYNRRLRSNPQVYRDVARMSAA
jgi:hypothetical protein